MTRWPALQLRELDLGQVDRNGEADAGARLGARSPELVRAGRDLIGDSDHPPVRVEQRAAGAARVYRGVGLNRVRDQETARRLDRAVEAGHDAGAQAAVEPERVTDDRELVADGDRMRAAQGEGMQRHAGGLAVRLEPSGCET